MRDLLLGALVHAGQTGVELVEAVVERCAKVFDFFGQREETGVDFVANGVELVVEFGLGHEFVVAALAWEYFLYQRGDGQDGDGGEKPVFELAGGGGWELQESHWFMVES